MRTVVSSLFYRSPGLLSIMNHSKSQEMSQPSSVSCQRKSCLCLLIFPLFAWHLPRVPTILIPGSPPIARGIYVLLSRQVQPLQSFVWDPRTCIRRSMNGWSRSWQTLSVFLYLHIGIHKGLPNTTLSVQAPSKAGHLVGHQKLLLWNIMLFDLLN